MFSVITHNDIASYRKYPGGKPRFIAAVFTEIHQRLLEDHRSQVLRHLHVIDPEMYVAEDPVQILFVELGENLSGASGFLRFTHPGVSSSKDTPQGYPP